MFDRYCIVETDDVREAQKLLAEHRNEQRKQEQQKVVAMQANR